MRILHLADVHLDRPFVGLSLQGSRQRRADVADAFARCLSAARERSVDLVTIGGDLWEDENVSPDTRASVAYQLGRLDIPVLLVAGNHDPYLRGGAYARTAWPSNVTVIDSSTPVEVPVSESVSIWSASWTERGLGTGFLRTLTVGGDGRTHVLLMHGTARDSRFASDVEAYAPFDAAEVREAGFVGVLCGHIHAASTHDGVIYPGSPEPLNHAETGRHCYALATVGDGRIEAELVDVNRRRYVAVNVDCFEAASSAEVETRVREQLEPGSDPSTILRVRLEGETTPDCSIDRGVLVAHLEQDFAAVTIEDVTESAMDLADLAGRKTADGMFVASMLDRIERADGDRERRILEMALRAGVRAMNGRKDVLRVG